jgi:hypothetical protein
VVWFRAAPGIFRSLRGKIVLRRLATGGAKSISFFCAAARWRVTDAKTKKPIWSQALISPAEYGRRRVAEENRAEDQLGGTHTVATLLEKSVRKRLEAGLDAARGRTKRLGRW